MAGVLLVNLGDGSDAFRSVNVNKYFFRLRQLLRSFPILMPLAYPLYRFIGLLYASQIPLRADFSDQPTFKHGLYGIFIAGGAKIGRGCTFFQHVTIGGISSTEERSGAPIIGDNCVLYPGVKLWEE